MEDGGRTSRAARSWRLLTAEAARLSLPRSGLPASAVLVANLARRARAEAATKSSSTAGGVTVAPAVVEGFDFLADVLGLPIETKSAIVAATAAPVGPRVSRARRQSGSRPGQLGYLDGDLRVLGDSLRIITVPVWIRCGLGSFPFRTPRRQAEWVPCTRPSSPCERAAVFTAQISISHSHRTLDYRSSVISEGGWPRGERTDERFHSSSPHQHTPHVTHVTPPRPTLDDGGWRAPCTA